jgi:hypothetical protein
MISKLIAQKFNLSNRANLWKLREYHGKLEHTYCDPLWRLQCVTAEHADRLIAAGRQVYVDVPSDDSDSNAPKVEDLQSVDVITDTEESDLELARRLA